MLINEIDKFSIENELTGFHDADRSDSGHSSREGGSTSKTPRTDEIIKDFVSGNGEAASIMLLRQDVE
jgi:hypothetical protein